MAKSQTRNTSTETSLKGLKVAILATDGVEQVELTEPRKALLEAGAEVHVVSPKDSVQMFKHHDKTEKIKADAKLAQVNVDEYDALVVPGGVINPDQLRMDEKAVAFVRSFADGDKPIAAICHGPWLLVEADIVRDHRIASWPSLKTDIKNAGAEWVDESVVRDGKLVTSRKPDDLVDFNREMLDLFSSERAGATTQKKTPRGKQAEATPVH